jgi:hypothetical protein
MNTVDGAEAIDLVPLQSVDIACFWQIFLLAAWPWRR